MKMSDLMPKMEAAKDLMKEMGNRNADKMKKKLSKQELPMINITINVTKSEVETETKEPEEKEDTKPKDEKAGTVIYENDLAKRIKALKEKK